MHTVNHCILKPFISDMNPPLPSAPQILLQQPQLHHKKLLLPLQQQPLHLPQTHKLQLLHVHHHLKNPQLHQHPQHHHQHHLQLHQHQHHLQLQLQHKQQQQQQLQHLKKVLHNHLHQLLQHLKKVFHNHQHPHLKLLHQ